MVGTAREFDGPGGDAMSPLSRNRLVRAELDEWLREGAVTSRQHADLAERYVVKDWDFHSLGRWFSIFGGISVAAGLYQLIHDVLHFTLVHLAGALTAVLALLFAGGNTLKKRGYRWPPRVLELLGGIALIGLSFVLGIIFSTGSGNWPALLLIDLVLLLVLSYTVNNILLMVLSTVVFFTWLGGCTGYDAGWGAYWFGMNYPLRFLGAAVAIVGAGVLHFRAEQRWLAVWKGFAKVWISCGIFLAEMALWLLSIFGNFGDMDGPWHQTQGMELLLFNALWLLGNLVVLALGTRLRFAMLRGYAVTFLVIQAYTLYFTKIEPALGFLAGTTVAGSSALALVVWLESHRREKLKDASNGDPT
jgi:hypothetical protein